MTDLKLRYTIHLADNALLLGHRNSEWCGHGPVLEQDIAITNISLDLIGQARNFYQYAALQMNDGSTEDTLAYRRDAREFMNCLLVEQPRGDWAETILRQFLFSNYQYQLYQQLQSGKDEQLAAISAKAWKEVAYHLRWSSEWVIRLGDGTEESHARMVNAIETTWPYSGELLIPASYEKENEYAVDLDTIRPAWEQQVKAVFDEAGLEVPGKAWMQSGGKEGNHSELLGLVLAEMQYLQRSYPDAQW